MNNSNSFKDQISEKIKKGVEKLKNASPTSKALIATSAIAATGAALAYANRKSIKKSITKMKKMYKTPKKSGKKGRKGRKSGKKGRGSKRS